MSAHSFHEIDGVGVSLNVLAIDRRIRYHESSPQEKDLAKFLFSMQRLVLCTFAQFATGFPTAATLVFALDWSS
jgi:hypothetical protein